MSRFVTFLWLAIAGLGATAVADESVVSARDRWMSGNCSMLASAITDQPAAPGDHLVGTCGLAFRACRTSVTRFPDGGVALPREAATALGVHVGDTVRFGLLRGHP